MSSEQTRMTSEHEMLNQLIGEWEGITKTWFDPAQPPADEATQQGTIRSLLGGKFVLHEYQSTLEGNPFQGMAIFGYDPGSQTFQCAWIDEFHMGTAIMFSEGPATEKGLSVLGSYLAATGEQGEQIRWGWRTEIEVVDKNRIIITMYNRSPEGQESKGIETVYTRRQWS